MATNQPSLISAALSFCTSFDAVSTVIPGAISEDQLLGNIGAMQHPIPMTLRRELEDFYQEEVKALKLPW